MKLAPFIFSKNLRTVKAQKNIIVLFFNKALAALVSFQIIPATLDYLDTELYGIWITLSSIVAWLVYFDFGLSHGFRNKFAIAKADGDIILARSYLSTSYFLLTVIFISIMLLGLVINQFIDWAEVLNLNTSLNNDLQTVFNYLIICFSIQMILNVIITLLLANQQPALSAIVVTIGQILALIAIYILKLYTHGNLAYLVIVLVGIPLVSTFIISLLLYKSILNNFRPRLSLINLKLSKDILVLGSKFFLIQISMLIIFQFSNFIIIRIMGAEAVAVYSIAYKYFSIIYIIMSIIFIPFWSAFTDAYTKKEFEWMQSTFKRLSRIWFVTIPVFLLLIILSDFILNKWLAKDLNFETDLLLALGIYMLIMSRANLYMSCLNGIGKVYLQVIIYSFCAIIAIPSMYYLTAEWGFYGVIFITSFVYLIQSIFGSIQLRKILKNTSDGIWNK